MSVKKDMHCFHFVVHEDMYWRVKGLQRVIGKKSVSKAVLYVCETMYPVIVKCGATLGVGSCFVDIGVRWLN